MKKRKIRKGIWNVIPVAAMLSVVAALPAMLCGCGGQGGKDESDRPTLRLFVNNGNYLDGAVKDSVWEYIEDQAGVNLEITGQVNSADYYTVLNPQLNSALDMPDIFFSVPGNTDGAYPTWADQATGILYDWNNLLIGKEEEYPYLQKVLNSNQYRNVSYGGAHTLLPNLTWASSGWGIYYRGDWLVKIGYFDTDENGEKIPRVPVTMDEFEDVMMKFSDPSYELNPGTVTYGLSPFAGEWANQPLYHAFGVSVGWDVDDEGNVEFSLMTQEYKNFLTWFHGCYEKGWIDPQFYANGTDGDIEAFEEGRTGILINSAGEHIQWKAVPMENVWGKGTCVMGPPPVGTANIGVEGACGWSNWGGIWGGFSITKACTDTDAALRLMNYLYSEEGALTTQYGIEGTHWEWNEEKTQIIPILENRMAEPEGAFALAAGPEGDQNLYGKHRFANVLLSPMPIDWEAFDETGEFSFFVDWSAINPEYAGLMEDSAQYFSMLYPKKLVNLGELPASLSKKSKIIDDLGNTYAIQAIAGQKNLTTDWDAYIEACEQQDLQAIVDAVIQTAREAGIME